MTWVQRLTLLAAVVTAASASCPSSEWKQYEEKCYWRSDYELRWEDVRRTCQSLFGLGSDMASIHDLERDVFIAEEVLGGVQAWIGLHRDYKTAPWTYTDGSPYDFHNWYGGDPEISGEACGAINHENEGAWGAYGCGETYLKFVCQVDR